MTFGISHHTDATGSDTGTKNGLVARMTRIAKQAVPEMIVMSDTLLLRIHLARPLRRAVRARRR